jgi:hypothetical protein
MGMEETIVPDPNFSRPVKDLVYKDLLTSTFTYESFNVKCHMDPNIGKTVRKGLLQRVKNHYKRRVVLIEIVSWKCWQKFLLT